MVTSSERGKKWRVKNKAHAKAYKKIWNVMNKDKMKVHERNRWLCEGNSGKPKDEKYKARMILNNAVAGEIIIKPKNCSQCGYKNSKIHGHHPNYNFPLQVVWVCPPCHEVFHA